MECNQIPKTSILIVKGQVVDVRFLKTNGKKSIRIQDFDILAHVEWARKANIDCLEPITRNQYKI